MEPNDRMNELPHAKDIAARIKKHAHGQYAEFRGRCALALASAKTASVSVSATGVSSGARSRVAAELERKGYRVRHGAFYQNKPWFVIEIPGL